MNRIDPAREAHIVGIEPPEIYCLKHDYPDLHPARGAEIMQRASKVWLLDEFLLRSNVFQNLRIGTNAPELAGKNDRLQTIRFHPHCHQRAEGLSADGLPIGTAATIDLLRSCGYDVELMDTGCCGMAGSFGYEAEHYDVSMKVGELKLFPQLRTRSALKGTSPKSRSEVAVNHRDTHFGFGGGREGVVSSSGAACRMQIQQGTGVNAIHPIVAVWSALKTIQTLDA